jgi:RimJ/RimL family protein N-acetyltransferase
VHSRLSKDHGIDAAVRRLVDTEWGALFGLSPAVLRTGGVHVVATDLGANDAMSFLLDDTCVVVVRPDELEAARAALSGVDAGVAFTADALRRLVGSGARVDGPSWHSYVTEQTFRGGADPAVEPIDGGDPSLLAFLEDNDIAEWAESGFPLQPGSADAQTTRFWVLREGRRIVAAGNMTEWRGLPADVGVLTHPNVRGQGLATRLAGTMVADMLPTVEVARYRALATNHASLAVALRLGFESYGQNYRARRPAA